MSLKDSKLLTLKEIEGPSGTHDSYLKRELEKRKDALDCVNDVAKLAEFIGGDVASLGLKADWTVKKEIFPGIEIIFLFNKADDEFPSSLRILYTGPRIGIMRGEDMADLSIACVNQMLRYVKETTDNPPEICKRM